MGGKKPLGKKKAGLGGAKKVVKKDFDELENKIKSEDDQRAKEGVESTGGGSSSEGGSLSSAKLKFAVKETKRDISKMDDHKKAQAERLGMGESQERSAAN